MRDISSKVATPVEQKFWTNLKVYFFCDVEQPLSLGQIAGVGVFVGMVGWALLMGAVIMAANF